MKNKPVQHIKFVATFVIASCAALLSAQSAPIARPANVLYYADAIYYNGHVLTGENLVDGQIRFVSALALRDGQIVAAGSDAVAMALAGPATRKIDLNHAFVMPGFNDAHVHLGHAGMIKLQVDLTGSTSLAEMKRRIQLAATGAPKARWLTGGGWDHTLWTDKTLPTRAEIDMVTAGHRAIFTRIDGHIAIANSAALAAAGITRATADPAGGKIDHDAQGEPTGILRESSAMALVKRLIPPPTEAERRRGLELAMADAVSHGLTSAQDNSDWEDFLVVEKMENEGKLPLRVTEWLAFDAPLDVLKQQRAAHDPSDHLLHTGMLKGFMDGSLGSKTAAMKLPYADDPGNSGLARYEQAKLNAMTKERTQEGFQIGFHAIGDRAAAMALDAYAAAGVNASLRDRIEHTQVVDPDDIPRFKSMGIVASMQPNHLLTDMRWAESRLGAERAKYSYAWSAFLKAGVPLAFGTDYPVEPVTPFRGVYAAITRKDEAGRQSFYPDSALTIAQALYAYTQGAAHAEFSETWKGKLSPGYAADFVILDRDITTIPPADILKTKVIGTFVGGRQVYVGGIKAASAR